MTLLPPGTQTPRRRRELDWELIACGVRGHVLVGIDAAHPRPQDAILMHEEGDVRWHRCLRCDCWVTLPTPAHPATEHPPDRDEIVIPLRGRTLHDRVILRLIALDRILHFIVLTLLGLGVLLFAADRRALHDAFYRVLTALQGGVAGGPVQSTGHVGILHELDKLFAYRTRTLHVVGVALLAYAVLEGVEAVGLWFGRRWAEYLTFVATTVLLPLEIYEIVNGGTVLKVIGFVINLMVVVYLLFKKRLFGLRGGGAAEEAQRAHDRSWEQIERATLSTPARAATVAP